MNIKPKTKEHLISEGSIPRSLLRTNVEQCVTSEFLQIARPLGRGGVFRKILQACIFSIYIITSNTTTAGSIEDLEPGHWLEIPNSNLSKVYPSPTPPGSTGSNSVIDSWNGGAYDTKRDRLIVWGGGHANYSGNEIYAFDINKLSWFRLTKPSLLTDWTDGDKAYSDGRPVSRHTYGYLEYIPPPIDKFVSVGGSALWKNSSNDLTTWYFDFETNEWEDMAPVSKGGVSSVVAYDPVTEQLWYHAVNSSTVLSSFNPKNNQWVDRGSRWTEKFGFSIYWSAAVDPIRRKFVTIGGGRVYVWDIGKKTGYIAATELITTGDSEIVNAENPGFEYDPSSDSFIAWSGGSHVYQLDMDTAEWTKVEAAVSNTANPTANIRGTFGRFRYIPSKNVFIVVNSGNENVFIYKLNNAKLLGSPARPTPPNSQLK